MFTDLISLGQHVVANDLTAWMYESFLGATLSSIHRLFTKWAFYGLWRKELSWPRGVWHRSQSVCLSLLPLPSLSKSTERQIVTAGCKGGEDLPPPLFLSQSGAHIICSLNYLIHLEPGQCAKHYMRTVASLFLTSSIWLLLYTLSLVFTHL